MPRRDSDLLKSWNQNGLTIGRGEEILAADKRGWTPIRKNCLVLSALIGVYRRLTCLLFAIPPSASTGARRDFWKRWLSQIPRGANKAGRPQEFRDSSRHTLAANEDCVGMGA